MTLVKNGAVVENEWVTVDDDTIVPIDQPAIVSANRWRNEKERLRQRNVPIGLRLSSDAVVDDIADALDTIELIALEFPAFTDGRSYSTARLLRERFGFEGEIRAVGQILRDQAQFMLRCGFDAFELAPGANVDEWIDGLSEIAIHYQPAADTRTSTAVLRHR